VPERTKTEMLERKKTTNTVNNDDERWRRDRRGRQTHISPRSRWGRCEGEEEGRSSVEAKREASGVDKDGVVGHRSPRQRRWRADVKRR